MKPNTLNDGINAQKDSTETKKSAYWNADLCPECGSAHVELFTYKENEHEYVRGQCRDCGAEWQSVRNDWGC